MKYLCGILRDTIVYKGKVNGSRQTKRNMDNQHCGMDRTKLLWNVASKAKQPHIWRAIAPNPSTEEGT